MASLIGATGLGQLVLRGINRVEPGTAFVGGISVVLMAIMIDRMTQGVAQWADAKERRSHVARVHALMRRVRSVSSARPGTQGS